MGELVYENDTLQFLQHEEGRVVSRRDFNGNFEGHEYQYYYKDHLGNVRMTFTSARDSMVFEATMESEYAATEDLIFANMHTRHTDQIGNHTVDASIIANESASLNGTDPDRTVGPALALAVSPGDTLKMEVYAAYQESTATSNTITAAALTTAVAGAFGGVIGGGEQAQMIYNMFEEALGFVAGSGTNTEQGVPKAYLQYLLFDENFVPLAPEEGGFGFESITSQAKITGSNDHEKVAFDQPLVIDKPGFIYIYVANESSEDVNVFFPARQRYGPGMAGGDDMKVTHIKSPIVQADNYYPFGLTFNGYQRYDNKKNRYLYNDGAERENALGLNVDFTKFRNYDPAIGRWWQIDPKSDLFQEGWTPYHYGFNNPILNNDPDGDIPPLIWAVAAVVALVLDADFAEAPGTDQSEQAQQTAQKNREELETVNDIITTTFNSRKAPKTIFNLARNKKKSPQNKTFKEIQKDVVKEKEKQFQKAQNQQKKRQQMNKKKEGKKSSTGSAEHTKGERKSTENKHQKGQSRKQADQQRSNNQNKKKDEN